ncbi:quinone-dependent dihydroorotate dehydrogenase [Alistipes sp.]|uniref:quinone-dependent dihydroorotate dehydrogenase n=1 Tax=Alistipes sp. TaxID=1872444 RepID=UPI003A83B1A4
MYRKFIKPLLFSLSIERAHRVVILFLRIVGLIPGGRWLLHKCYAVENPSLEREVFGLHFPNPVGLAAGFDRNGEACRELGALGFGFVEIGTVTPQPQSGNPRPRVFRLPKDRAIVQRIGLANRGLAVTIRHLRRPHEGVIIGCNIGKNTATPPEQAPADYLKVFRNLYQYADYFTVNINCDNACREGTAYTRDHILKILEPLFDFRRGQNQYRPIMLKVSPDMPDEVIDRVTDILLETPLDGIVATNGTNRRDGLQTSRLSLEKIGSGRISGAPLTRRAVEIVRRIHTRSGGTYPIIGVGGLMTPDDVRAMLEAGADLVQLYTGYIYEGPGLVGDICRALIAGEEQRLQEAAKAVAEPTAAKPTEAAAEKAAEPTVVSAETPATAEDPTSRPTAEPAAAEEAATTPEPSEPSDSGLPATDPGAETTSARPEPAPHKPGEQA